MQKNSGQHNKHTGNQELGHNPLYKRVSLPSPDQIDRRPATTQTSRRRSGRVGAGVLTALATATLAVKSGFLSVPEGPKLPTVAEYDADPKKYPNFTKITLDASTPNAWTVAELYMSDRDPREASDMLLAEDARNEKAGIGNAGFDVGDPLIVPMPKTHDAK